jgi:hypothetical protein
MKLLSESVGNFFEGFFGFYAVIYKKLSDW